MKQAEWENGVLIKEIGSFFVGGQTVTLTGQPQRQLQVTRSGPPRIVDQNGDYITGQTYIFAKWHPRPMRLSCSGMAVP